MIMHIDPPLPCDMLSQASSGPCPCGTPTTTALVTRIHGGAWELLPVCEGHLKEAVDAGGSLPPPTRRPEPVRISAAGARANLLHLS